MIRVALLTSALLACARAHVYERCELARELTSLGVQRDHLATWVCIAYHESRFDTAARNHGSGDHGLFQISELYWCGSGKACGVPCTAFRDEDISNDLECALKIHKEHTYLQGDGFLAWVVYPQHCKHINTKKYLIDCEASLKDVTVNLDAKSRSLKNYISDTTTKPFDANYYAKHLPSFLAINSIFEGNQAKQSEGEEQKIDWLNFKIDNIDNIKLPMLNKDELIKFVTPPTTTTTTTVKYFEDNYSTKNSKHHWINYKFDDIDSLKLTTLKAGNQQNNINSGLPSWLNIKIDSKIDDLALPVLSNDAANKYLAPSSSPATYINYEENYLGKSYKNDWVNFKVDNIDDLKLPPLNINVANQQNSGLPNWLNIKIDSRIDDLKLPVNAISNDAVNKYVPLSSTTKTLINYEENYLDQSYNHDWVNFKIDNIDDLQLSQLSKNVANQRNSGPPSWLNIKIDSRIDNIDLPTFEKIVNVESSTRGATTISTTIRTTTIDPELIGIKPAMPRRIESNQFRRKMMLMEAMLAKLDVIDIKNMSVKADSLFGANINSMPEITTTKIQSQPTTTHKPATSVATTYTPNTNTLYKSTPPTTKSVLNFQWKSTSRPNTPSKEVTTQKSVSPQQNITHANAQLNQSNVEVAIKTTVNSRLTTQSPYIVNKPIINDRLTLQADTVVTTTQMPNKYSQERSTTSPALSTTTSQPTTTSRYAYTYSSPVLTTTAKPKITTVSSPGNFDWNKRFQEFQKQFTFKPFSWSSQKPTTSRPYLHSNMPTLKPSTFNTSNVLTLQNRLSGTKSNLLPVRSTTTKPYWIWSTSQPQTGLANKTSVTLSSWYKPFSTTLAPNKAGSLQEKSNAQFTTVNPPARRRWSFSIGTNSNKPLEPQINILQSVTAQTTTSTSRPFSTNKTDVFNKSSESRKYSSLVSQFTKPAQEFSTTAKSISTTVKSLAYNASSSAKPQIVTVKPLENPDQLITKSTPSIFDLYLRPEKYYSVPQFQFPSRSFSANKLTIFSRGTTPPAANFTHVKP